MAVLRVEATVMQVQGLLEDGLEHVVGHDGTLAVQCQVLEGRQVLQQCGVQRHDRHIGLAALQVRLEDFSDLEATCHRPG